jgi:hypothetical protein
MSKPNFQGCPKGDAFTELQYQVLGAVVRRVFDAVTDEIDKRIAANPSVRHVGTWKEGRQYRSGDLVTHARGLWLAKRNSKQRPGSSDDYQLIVKSGSAA